MNPHNHKTTRARVMQCPAASQWLKSALQSCAHRDPVDNVKDAALLLDILTAEMPTPEGWTEFDTSHEHQESTGHTHAMPAQFPHAHQWN